MTTTCDIGNRARGWLAVVVVLVALGVTACESDEAKLRRLEEDAAVARLEEWSATRHGEPAESLAALRIRRELAERAVNQFMAGR